MVKAVPDGYHTVTPYLTVPDGDAMLVFLQGVFGAKLTERMNDSNGTLKHAELQLGDSKIMVGQASEQYKSRPQTLYVYLPDVDATYKRALNAGSRSLQEVTDQFYGDRTGGFEDPAGNWWYIATHTEDISMEEMQRRLQNLQA